MDIPIHLPCYVSLISGVPTGIPHQVSNDEASLALSVNYVDATNVDGFLSSLENANGVDAATVQQWQTLALEAQGRTVDLLPDTVYWTYTENVTESLRSPKTHPQRHDEL